MTLTAHHQGVNVSDIDTALEFYRDTLGFEVDMRIPMSDVQSDIVGVEGIEGELAFVDTGEFKIELISYASPDNENVHEQSSGVDIGVTHLCFEVDDLQAEYDELRSGVEFVNEPQTVENGAEIVYGRDPDGNFIEFIELPEGME
ncbi:VOC family protein [Halobellus sp. GM3]|uniref:VOC family protein n=1 Tax=Halobellus sp. GM3 TaxID=3458410 RepID=UPI00403E27C9